LLSKFSQNGWNVGILNYKRTNQNDIPMQISLEGYNSYLKIKITSWTF
jgi:outer membrane biogenesis lipoprotein LolB